MKSRLIILILLVTGTLCGQVVAQDLLNVYDQETMYIHYSIRGDGFVKNGLIMNMGVLGSNLTEEMVGSEFALEEMQRYRKYKVAGMATNLVATGFGITGIVLAFRDDDSESRTFEITSLIVGALCGVLSDAFNRSATTAMNRAVWFYNRDVMSGRLR